MKIVVRLLISIILYVPLMGASTYTDWTEDPSDPIYNPEPFPIAEDYFPCVVYSQTQFDGHGGAVLYKMWHQGADVSPGNGGLALSYSNDGITWTLQGNISPNVIGYHPCVVYDSNAFGEPGNFFYKMWFWTGNIGLTNVDVIQFMKSVDGINWTAPVPVTQSVTSPLAVGTSGEYFYHLYGPGFVEYNPTATSTPGKPLSFPYVMFFDTATETPIPINPMNPVSEQIGLAYSTDGLFWTRFGTTPIALSQFDPTTWDATHMFRPSLVKSQNMYHIFYSGSNDTVDPLTTVPYAHGIGHASSPDGITWTKDPDNPIFIFSDGVAWRDSRTYTPCVIFSPFCDAGACPTCFAKMWFAGGTGTTAGANQGIGYATLPCPPLSPINFIGTIQCNAFLNKTEYILTMTWQQSPTPGIVAYDIFNSGILIGRVNASSPLVFVTCIPLRHATQGFTVVAVAADAQMSDPLTLKME